MIRLLLVVALVAVTCDAYFARGEYTRLVVDRIEIGIRQLSANLREQRSPEPVAPVPSAPPVIAPPPLELRPDAPRP